MSCLKHCPLICLYSLQICIHLKLALWDQCFSKDNVKMSIQINMFKFFLPFFSPSHPVNIYQIVLIHTPNFEPRWALPNIYLFRTGKVSARTRKQRDLKWELWRHPECACIIPSLQWWTINKRPGTWQEKMVSVATFLAPKTFWSGVEVIGAAFPSIKIRAACISTN